MNTKSKRGLTRHTTTLGRVNAAVMILLGASTAAHAQDAADPGATSPAPAASAASRSEELQTVIVTGTRDPHKTAAQSLSPISIVGAKQLAQTGQADLRDALVMISPSISRQHITTGPAKGIDKISMRGLPSDNTLIMVNGIRRHTSPIIDDAGGPENGTAPTDLGTFPSSAIGRIEVLLDGASAQYGADAIAGVANIILKENDHGGSFSTSNGYYPKYGDGFTSLTTGNAGFKLGDSGFLSLSAEYLHKDHTVRSNPDSRTGTTVNKYFGQPSQSKGALSYNAGIDLSDNVRLYSFSTAMYRESSTYQYYRLPTVLPQVFPNGFEPQTASFERDWSSTVGLKGQFGEWDWNMSGTYGYNHADFVTSETVNLLYFQDFGNTPTRVHNGAYGGTEATAQIDLNRSFDIGLSKPLAFAFGGQVRHSTWKQSAGDLASYYGGGTQGSGGFPPEVNVSASEKVSAAYVDIAFSPSTNLSADLAARYEKYSLHGGKTTGKLSTRYDFSPTVAIRGTISNGFRAPTLAMENMSLIGVTPAGDQGQLAVNSLGARSVGAKPLKSETSTNYSAGLVWNPAERMTFTLDAYQIAIKDRIVIGGVINGQRAIDAYALMGLGTNPGVDPNAVYLQYFTNGVDTRTRGIDAVWSYSNTRFGQVRIDWDAAANFSRTKIQRIAVGPDGQPLVNASGASFLSTATPGYKFIFGGNLTAGNWEINLHEILWGGTKTLQQYTSGPNANSLTEFIVQRNRPKWQTNAELGYKINNGLKVSLGATNLFNATPTKLPLEASYYGVYKYDPYSQQIGMNGAYYYLTLGATY